MAGFLDQETAVGVSLFARKWRKLALWQKKNESRDFFTLATRGETCMTEYIFVVKGYKIFGRLYFSPSVSFFEI